MFDLFGHVAKNGDRNFLAAHATLWTTTCHIAQAESAPGLAAAPADLLCMGPQKHPVHKVC